MIEAWWSLPAEDVASRLGTSRDGLSSEEATLRLARFGLTAADVPVTAVIAVAASPWSMDGVGASLLPEIRRTCALARMSAGTRAEPGDAAVAPGRANASGWTAACAGHESVQGPSVTHSICPRCLAQILDESGVLRSRDESTAPRNPQQ